MNPDSTSPIRVRFCPSPTGTPHVGMVRTCLFNWAYARHTGGTFVFRIEDTDAKRDSEESFQQILESLRWLGLDWDEGVDKGGPYGPYRQSERMDIYKEVADKLLAGGYAYESYSTPEEIAARHKAAGRNPHLGYDGYDRNLTEEQIAAFRAEGRQPVLRMRMPDEDITFHDLVRGDITFQAGSVPDYVIVRGGGDPLHTPGINSCLDAYYACAARGRPALLHSAPNRALPRPHRVGNRRLRPRVRAPALCNGGGQQETIQAGSGI